MNIRFDCPVCAHEAQVAVPGAAEWECRDCDHLLAFPTEVDPKLPACLVCGNGELYKKKDFPHGLGLGILIVACVASTFTYARADRWATWAILIGSALFDALLYLWVKDVIVCYRCGAQFRGVTPNAGHKPFELTIGERYRQERLRRQQMHNTNP